MIAFREAVFDYQQGEKHMVASIPDPTAKQRLSGAQLKAYVENLKREDNYCRNSWQSAQQAAQNAAKLIETAPATVSK